MLHSSSMVWASPLSLDVLVTASGTPIPCNRATLCSGSAYFSSHLLDSTSGSTPPVSIDLPTVPPDMFTKLLACLYTGKLDCTVDSVYQLFWYAQMLQMPNAVLQCSQFLAKLATANTTSSSSTNNSSSSSSTPPSPPSSAKPNPRVIKPIPSRGIPLLSISSDLGPSFLRPHLASFYSDWFLRYSTLTRQSRQEEHVSDIATPSTSRQGEDRENHEVIQPTTSSMFNASNSLLDTASCDGPVKFHRIINKFFSVDFPKPAEAATAEPKKDEDIEVKEDESDESNDTGETYSCVYCNHVFKSHYCYQKHKRRHINPVTVDIQGNDQDKKFLVMKDLNVQYFPCKICGAKFPSYYFVHKHKKLWHRAQLELEQELEKQQSSDHAQKSEQNDTN